MTDDVDRCVEGAAAAHQRLLALVDQRLASDELDGTAATLLPGWTVGHVLTHLARNADSFTGLIEAAAEGRVVDQYPGGQRQRDGDIEAGAVRPADELVGDLRRSIWRLEASWASCPADAWSGRGRIGGVDVAIADLPFRRWREVEVHSVDLDFGLTFENWSHEYVRRELRRQEMHWRARTPMGLSGLPQEALNLTPPLRLAWLLGRAHVAGLPEVEGI